jgi:competence protein ComEC
VLAAFVYGICRLLLLPPRRSAFIVLGFVLLYGFVTVPSPPVIRSVILFGTILVGVILRRSIDVVQLLAVSAILMLMFQPLDVFNAGFQLSFGAVLGLAVFTTPMMEVFLRLEDPDMAVARSLIRPTGFAAWFLRQRRILLGVLGAGIVAWLVTLPLLLYHFERLNPWAIVASIALAPVVFAGLIGGLMKVVLTLTMPWWAGVWAMVAGWPMGLMRHSVEWLGMLPGSDLLMPRMPVWGIGLYYVCLWFVFYPPVIPRFRWTLRTATWATPAGCVALPIVLGAMAQPSGVRVTVLAVGAGSCAVVETPTRHCYLIDAGSSSYPGMYRTILKPFLRERGIRQIDGIYVSHANADHFNGVEDAAEEYGAGNVFVTGQFVSDASENVEAEVMLDDLTKLGKKAKTISAPMHVSLDKNVDLELIWPPADPHYFDNESSMVLKLNYEDHSVLFTGDIEVAAEKSLVLDANAIHCDVLIAPHHGSSESTSAAFVAAANPKVIVSSNDSTLTQKQIVFEQIARGRELRRTHDCGAVTVELEAGKLPRISTFRQK